jgi:small subunit ribosomal protein S16
VLVIRLSRAGTKNKPFYHVVVSESTRTPTSRVTDRLGYYDPLRKPKVVQIDVAKADEWVRKGAHPSPTVSKLIEQARTAPAETAAVETTSAETAPTETTPTEAAPTETAPADTTPAQA